ncbi:DUF2235 domain-containing protein [Shewanella submarina]|uniref:DUF2235 domain-containing protein n=1 Tax=Shewanella submarina TaxID=2016376 RepID=A0ABV7G5K5_9GAMM|nr:DUF2235 domain-containing protein [Shewanella submarina]MCL1038506.1 DUF2235 domain-containing protein [Shewanella submarina]
MRNLIVCCDGTWNNPQQEENGIPAPTNVVKLYNAISSEHNGIEQLKYYHPGLGGEGTGIKDKILDGVLGVNLKRHACSAYHWLAANFQSGDRIFLFGFSRGAFTVRCVAGMLNSGLVNLDNVGYKDGWKNVDTFYEEVYRKGNKHWIQDSAIPMHAQGSPCEVAFLGVWDTVGALGVPDNLKYVNWLWDSSKKWRFHDYGLGDNVLVARHAMALDEIRSSFTVSRWNNLNRHEGNVRERWFPGVHADVGGGYAECELSNRALAWMMDEASDIDIGNLGFRHGWRNHIPSDPNGVMHNSYKGVFSKLRSRPRNIPFIHPSTVLPEWEEIDESVFERQKFSPMSYYPYHAERKLGLGNHADAEVFASSRWNNTGIYLEVGTYWFEAEGEWQDSKDSCSWYGTEGGERTFGDFIRTVMTIVGKGEKAIKRITKSNVADIRFTRRHEQIPWFRMVGVITNDIEKKEDVVVGHDGSPCPHQYFDATKYPKHKPLTVTKAGYLYAYPNDAWRTYYNNRGSVTLKVTRVS